MYLLVPSLSLSLLLIPVMAQSSPFKQSPSTLITTRCSSPPNAKLGTPTYGSSGITFTICSERDIQAPIDKIYDALLDFEDYSEWNSFVVDVTQRDGSSPPVGMGFEMTFKSAGLLPGGSNASSDEVVSVEERDLGEGKGMGRIMMNGWKYQGLGQKAEHPNLLVELGNGMVRYVSWESYYGFLAPVTAILKGRLREGFERQADDLKRLVEGR